MIWPSGIRKTVPIGQSPTLVNVIEKFRKVTQKLQRMMIGNHCQKWKMLVTESTPGVIEVFLWRIAFILSSSNDFIELCQACQAYLNPF